MAKYAFIKQHRTAFPVLLMCRVLEVSRSGFYDWLVRKPSERQQNQVLQEVAVRAAHQKTRQTYGARRLHTELLSEGHNITAWQVRKVKERLNLRCIQAQKFKATTNSNHTLPVAENLLAQCFEPTKPNEMWVSDITYIRSDEGWLYLAGIKDVFTCEIVGYAMGSRMTKDLVSAALTLALAHKRPEKGLILHSDRGSQYCSHSYQKQIVAAGLRASMSRKGNCYDNAPMESFWGSLKNELVHHRRYATRTEAQEEITEYIEIFYNRQRRHSRLGDVAPAVFAREYERQQFADA